MSFRRSVALRAASGVRVAANQTDPYWGNGAAHVTGDPEVTSLFGINESALDASTTLSDFNGLAYRDGTVRNTTAPQVPPTPAITGTAGGVQWDTASAPAGLTRAIRFDGTAQLEYTGDSGFQFHNAQGTQFEAGDFTVEFFVRCDRTSRQDIIGQAGSGSEFRIVGNRDAAGDLQYFRGTAQALIASGTGWNNGNWNHIALVRRLGKSTGEMRFAVNGVWVGTMLTGGESLNIQGSAGTMLVGNNQATTATRLGSGTGGSLGFAWLAGVRFTDNKARYIPGTNFPPPSLPYPTSA